MGFKISSAGFLVETQARTNLGMGGKLFMVSATGGANYQEMVRDWAGADFDGEIRFFTTLALANTAAVANRGDVVLVAPGYTETIVAAAGTALSKAGTTWIGLGTGQDRPRITFGTSTAASMTITGAGTTVKNIIGIAGIDGLTKPFDVSAAQVTLDIEWQDASASVEAARAVLVTSVADFTCNIVYKGFTAGNAVVNAVRLVACSNPRINIDAYGVCSTAWVEFLTTASTNVVVTGGVYTSGVTNGTRDIVDTATGSTWFGRLEDRSAGAVFSGGSGSAWATDDITALAAAITVIDDLLDTEFPIVVTAVGAVGDAVLADTIEGSAAATSMVADIKGVLQRIGADSANNSASTALVVANNDGSLLERAEYITTDLLALPRCVEKADGAVLSGDDDIFTITGGPIKVLEITGIVTTIIGAGTTNGKITLTTTDPAATVDVSAAAVDIDGDVVGTSYQHINTTAILTPVTAGFVKEANAFATLPTTFLMPIGTVKFNSSAARTGNIKWYLRYVPLSPLSRVIAAA